MNEVREEEDTSTTFIFLNQPLTYNKVQLPLLVTVTVILRYHSAKP